MASTKNLAKRGQAWLTYGALLLLGILVGHAIPGNSATPNSVTGATSAASGGADTFKLAPKGAKATSYKLTNQTVWQVTPGAWKSGMPPCLAGDFVRTTSSSGAPKPAAASSKQVTIGVISVPSVTGGGPLQLVVWVRCPA